MHEGAVKRLFRSVLCLSVSDGVGYVLLARLHDLQAHHPQVGDVRGRGAMIAVELVEPGSTTPAPALVSAISKYCHTRGVVTLVTGTYGNVIRFRPPLTIPEHLLHEGLDVLAEALAPLSTKLP